LAEGDKITVRPHPMKDGAYAGQLFSGEIVDHDHRLLLAALPRRTRLDPAA